MQVDISFKLVLDEFEIEALCHAVEAGVRTGSLDGIYAETAKGVIQEIRCGINDCAVIATFAKGER